MNSPWIDAKERLPEPDQRVIVHFGPTGQYTDAVISYHGDNGVWRSVLFWMPIPELPKPDPFEEWALKQERGGAQNNCFLVCAGGGWVREDCAKVIWKAGFQWARSHPETDDAWKKAPGQRE